MRPIKIIHTKEGDPVKITTQSIECVQTMDKKYRLTIETNHDIRRDVEELQNIIRNGKGLSVEIKQHRPHRSLDSNAYLWVLCQKIAEAIGGTKEDIYREAVRKAGQFDFVAVSENAADTFIKSWQSKGLGWYAEVSESKIKGCKKVMVYHGSSCYDSKAMSHLLDYIVSEAKSLGIETIPPHELEAMKRGWNA
jgi:hypothetical protein